MIVMIVFMLMLVAMNPMSSDAMNGMMMGHNMSSSGEKMSGDDMFAECQKKCMASMGHETEGTHDGSMSGHGTDGGGHQHGSQQKKGVPGTDHSHKTVK